MNTPERGRERLCPDARALLPAYVENELSPVEVTRVQGHLNICDACRQEEIIFRSALGALRAESKPAHGDLYSGFAAKIDQLERRPAFRPKQFRWAGALACLILAVGVGATVVGKTLFNHAAQPAPGNIASVVKPPVVHDKGLVKKTPSVAPVAPKDERDPFAPVTVDVTPDTGSTAKGDSAEPRYYAEDTTTSEPEKLQRPRARREEFDPSRYSDIRSVRAKNGETLEDVISRLKKNGQYSLGGNEPKNDHQYSSSQAGPPSPDPGASKDLPAAPINDPSLPDVAVVVPEKEKSETVGEKVVTSSRAEGFDKAGKLALIRLDAQASPKTKKKIQPQRDPNDGEK